MCFTANSLCAKRCSKCHSGCSKYITEATNPLPWKVFIDFWSFCIFQMICMIIFITSTPPCTMRAEVQCSWSRCWNLHRKSSSLEPERCSQTSHQSGFSWYCSGAYSLFIQLFNFFTLDPCLHTPASKVAVLVIWVIRVRLKCLAQPGTSYHGKQAGDTFGIPASNSSKKV